MILVVASGEQYWVHFRHLFVPDKRTQCTIHRGPCTRPAAGTACAPKTLEGLGAIGYGTARCSEKDNFEFAMGRKLAFERAVRNYTNSKALRRELWAGFLTRSRLPKNRV